MSLNHSPSIVTNGLVFYYDMGNTKKSWKGWPVTNQFTLPSSATNGFGVQNSTFTRIYSGTYGNYTISPTDYVWKYNITGSDCPYHGWDIPTTTGTVVTFSFDYYVSPTSVGYPSTNFLANIENTGFGGGGSFADPTPSIVGVWKKGYITSTATANGNARCLMYPGACGGQLATSGFILYKNPQVEFNAPGGLPTPFVAGTRSSTQSILDLTNNNTITATSLTYNSDGSFNGSNSVISTPLFSNANTNVTMNGWFYVNLGTTGTFLSNGDDPGGYCIGIGTYLNTADNQITALFGYVRWILTGFYYQYTGWHMITMTLDNSGTPAIYINGNLIGTFPGSAANTPSAGAGFSVGSQWGIRYANTISNNVQFYNRCLSAQEILQNFNALRGRFGL
jgi:Concanavalin A-like lectin/glucanases superfamily